MVGPLAVVLAVLVCAPAGPAVWQWWAKRARDAAIAAQAEAERQRETLERFDYRRAIRSAHQEWRHANVSAALALLDSTRTDLRGWEWRYVHRLCHSDLLTFKAHTGQVASASFSADGSRVVTGSQDNTAKVWDASPISQ